MTLKGAGIMAAAEEVNTTAPLRFFSNILDTKWCVICTAEHALHSMLVICVSIVLWWAKCSNPVCHLCLNSPVVGQVSNPSGPFVSK
jgi:hypothetical protein